METYAAIKARFPEVIADLVLSYFLSKQRNAYHIGLTGEYESSIEMKFTDIPECLEGACEGGYINIVKFFIENNVFRHVPIISACDNNHVDIVEYLYNKGHRPHVCTLNYCTEENNKALEKEIRNGTVRGYYYNFFCHYYMIMDDS